MFNSVMVRRRNMYFVGLLINPLSLQNVNTPKSFGILGSLSHHRQPLGGMI